MSLGCYEISIPVIVKQMQHIGIIRVFCLPMGTYYVFQHLGRQIKLLGCGVLRWGGGSQYPGLHYARIRENMNENGNKNVNEKDKIPIFYIVFELMFHIGPLTLNK